MIISAFQACGKTYAFNKMKNIKGLKVLDSDSSKFSWMEVIDENYERKNRGKKDYKEQMIKVRNPEFPQNYIQHIKENMEDTNYLFVSSHKAVRDALKENKISYVLVYPERNRLDEWIGRCYLRGDNKRFIDTMIEHWDEWITECENEDGCTEKISLKSLQYLWDVIKERSR